MNSPMQEMPCGSMQQDSQAVWTEIIVGHEPTDDIIVILPQGEGTCHIPLAGGDFTCTDNVENAALDSGVSDETWRQYFPVHQYEENYQNQETQQPLLTVDWINSPHNIQVNTDENGSSPCSLDEKQTKHIKERERKCSSKKLSTDSALQCSKCPATFVNLANLRTHERVHTGERSFSCNVCHKSFTQAGHLKAHQRIHTGEKPYHCKECGKGFTQLAGLQTHKRKHTGEKPFHCSRCDKTFFQLSNLQAHLKRHSRVMPFACSHCTMCFFNQQNLNVHQRTHTGERPFQCTICSKTFIQSGHLKTHLKTHKKQKVDSIS